MMSQARSLWRLELARTKWAGGFINWLHPMRIRHLTTGRYLGVKENNELYLVDRLILIFRKVQGSRRDSYGVLSIIFPKSAITYFSKERRDDRDLDILAAAGEGRSKDRSRGQGLGSYRHADY